MEFKIEKGIPIPPRSKYTPPPMDVGDSFATTRGITNTLRARYDRSYPEYTIAVRKQRDGQYRLWRIK